MCSVFLTRVYHRDLLQRFFFPWDYQTKEVVPVAPGMMRQHAYLDVSILFTADTKLHIPFLQRPPEVCFQLSGAKPMLMFPLEESVRMISRFHGYEFLADPKKTRLSETVSFL